MDVSKVKRSLNKDQLPERIPVHGGYGGGAGGGSMRRGGHDDMRVQFEELKEMNRMFRSQLQTMQTEREKNLENNRKLNDSVMMLRRKIDELKFEKADMQKALEQKGYQRNQVSLQEHEKLVKRYDQLCGQVKMMQHEREQLEQRYQQDKHEVEGQLMDNLRSVKLSLEDSERDRDSLRFKLAERKRELDRVREQLNYLVPNQDSSKKELSKILEDRDSLRVKVGEMKQERLGLQEKLASANRTMETLRASAPVNQQVTELQMQVAGLQQQLFATRKDRDELMEANNELRRSLEAVEMQLRDTDSECNRLRQALMDPQRGISPNRRLIYERNSTSSGNLYSGESDELRKYRMSGPSRERSQGSMEEDLNMGSDASDHPNSFSDLTSLTRTSSGQSGSLVVQPPRVAEKNSRKSLGKLSSSTSSLSNDPLTKFPDQSSLQLQKVLRLEKCLEEVKKDNLYLNSKVTDMETERFDLTSQLDYSKKHLEGARKELTSTSSKFKEARSQIDMLDKEKGVALRDNAASYEQFIQLETQLREFKAEKQILEQQKDIAKKELDRVITESVNAKKKLETIMIQRSKDAKDLSAMRHIKDKTVQDMNEMKKKLEQLQKSQDMMEEEAGNIRDIVHRAVQKLSLHSRKGSSNASLHSWTAGGGAGDTGDVSMLHDLGMITETMQQLENDRRVIVRKLFGQEGGADQGRSLSDMVHCIDGLIHDREDLMVEVDALHQSSSKHSEQRIFELKQKLEDISAENKSLKREVNSRSQLLVKAEQNRDQLSAEYARLDLQLQQLKNRHAKLVEDHDKTLERVAERWKQNWPMEWDDGWEEKHVTVMLDAEGYAGFSVVGGCDQPQLPSPGAFFITMVNQGGPAEGLLKPGDVLESINGISLNNSHHRDAVRAVKESKRSLTIGYRRRRHASHLMMGLVQPILSVPHLTPTSSVTPTNMPPASEKPEQMEYSLLIDSKENKSDIGFRYDWSVVCTISEVKSPGPADQILKPGDRILKVNNAAITREKPSVVKKLMKPHKNILRLTIERPSKEKTYMGQPPPSKDDMLTSSTSWSPNLKRGYVSSGMEGKRGQSWSEDSTPIYSSKHCHDYSEKSLTSHASFSALDRIGLTHGRSSPTKDYNGGGAGCMIEGGASNMPYTKSRSRESYSSRDSKEGYSQDTQSQDSSGSRPTKLSSMVTRVRAPSKPGSAPPTSTRPSSDGMMYGEFNERRLEYDDVLASERSDSQYSQSESYLSESSYDYGLSSSQSIDLTFHTISTIPTHNRLTVDTMMTTQAPTQPHQHSEDEEGGVGFLARDDVSRTTFRTRNSSDPNTNGNNSEGPGAERSESAQGQSLSQEFTRERRVYGMGIRRKGKQKHQKSNSVNGSRSLSKLSSSSDQSLTKASSNLAMRGRSRSQLSLGRAPSMTSVIEEPPRKSISTTDMSSYEHDPLADATYIRANFTYTPRNPKELSIKAGDIFHIHDEAPSERFRSFFWVSRLNEDGTDEQIGAIPNSMRGQEYLSDQGETLDFALYEEVEPYTGLRPVVILGALADQVMTALLENLPNMFYQCEKAFVSSAGRVTEARLGRELSEKKIIDFYCKEGGFEILQLSSITKPPSKIKHCLMTGSPHSIQTLKAIAPPISILVKALTPESITTFSPEPISITEAKEVFDTAKDLEENHASEFTGSLFLIFMETLMGQIEDIIRAEKRKQAWVPVSRLENS